MYKDREKQKEANKDASQRRRDKVKGMTKGMTQQGMTEGTRGGMTISRKEPWYPNKRTDEQGGTITPVILSDGQKWYLLSKTKGLSGEILNNIKKAGKIFNDTEGRMERALRYAKWIDNGKPRDKSVALSNGAYIAVDKLVDKKWRGLLTYLTENLKPAYQDSIRVGMSGPSVRECKKLLEVTA